MLQQMLVNPLYALLFLFYNLLQLPNGLLLFELVSLEKIYKVQSDLLFDSSDLPVLLINGLGHLELALACGPLDVLDVRL